MLVLCFPCCQSQCSFLFFFLPLQTTVVFLYFFVFFLFFYFLFFNQCLSHFIKYNSFLTLFIVLINYFHSLFFLSLSLFVFSFVLRFFKLTYSCCKFIILFTNPSARSRSIFKRSLTGLNSEFSFS